jgi:pyruvate/2-oxoglutarate dehydrogenase complex dihydrolipoamide dehydrogenase (E3) component
MTVDQYDAIVIGSGQGGKPLSIALAKAGWKTALIERALVGGTCINYGCTPTKTIVASARVAYLSKRAADYGVHHDQVAVNLAEVRARKQKIVDDFRSGSERAIESTANLTLVRGQATFINSTTLEIRLNSGGTRTLSAPKIMINTGGRPANPSFPGCDLVKSLDSTSIMELEELPRHLMVVGGGYIGLEFGQIFRRFGSEVTIVQRGGHLLGREDPDVAEEIAKILHEDGVQFLFNTEPTSVERDQNGEIRLALKSRDGESAITGSHLLLAIGRKPNTEDLNLAAAGVETDSRGNVIVNERLETDVPGIYALGDVNGGPQFTHISYDDFRILRANLLENGDATTKGRLVPYTLFTDPQLGRVGMTEIQAREEGRNIRVAKIPMNYVARALEMSESRGFMKAVVDADTSQILGCAVLGIEGGELMAMLEIAMMGRVPYTVLKDGVFAHPTLAESLNTLFMSLDQ